MKKTLIFILLLAVKFGFACDPCEGTFCAYLNYASYEIIVSAKIIEIDTLQAKLAIIDKFHGEINLDTITVWADKDSLIDEGTSCEETVSMNISRLGKLNDSLVICLNAIKTIENCWDIIGDYRIPLRNYNAPWLKITSNTVTGPILSDEICMPDTTIREMSYPIFKSYWSEGTFNCGAISLTSIKNNSFPETKIEVKEQQLSIHASENSNLKLEIINILGQPVFATQFRKYYNLGLEPFGQGIFLICLYNESKLVGHIKIVLD